MKTVDMSITVPALHKLGIIQYAFTTKKNNLGARINGFKQLDDWNPVAEAFGISGDRLVTVSQIHGETIIRVDEGNRIDVCSIEADALITNVPGIAVGVETADCVPVLLVDPVTPAVAAVHAGWRSTVKKIAQKAVQMMQKEFGSDPSRMFAAIGPSIGPECYEVDEAVMGPVREVFPFWKEVASARNQDRWSLDLVKLNRMELVQVGIPEQNVHSVGLCTSCNPDQFYSFRREGRTGRMLSMIMIKA